MSWDLKCNSSCSSLLEIWCRDLLLVFENSERYLAFIKKAIGLYIHLKILAYQLLNHFRTHPTCETHLIYCFGANDLMT